MKYAIIFSAAVFALIYCAVFVDPFRALVVLLILIAAVPPAVLIWFLIITDDFGRNNRG